MRLAIGTDTIGHAVVLPDGTTLAAYLNAERAEARDLCSAFRKRTGTKAEVKRVRIRIEAIDEDKPHAN